MHRSRKSKQLKLDDFTPRYKPKSTLSYDDIVNGLKAHARINNMAFQRRKNGG
jgi:hypothetical protein